VVVKKILFGAVIGAVIMYFLDPVGGADRRRKLSGDWAGQKDTVLEAARSSAAAAAGLSQNVGAIVGGKASAPGGEGDSTNGNVVTATGPEGRAHK
jgi:hypothetical protein